MSVLSANCPSCAGPIEFKKGASIVVVCPFCRSAVHRKDRKLEDLGKVAEVVDSKSPLKLGLKGTYKGKRFELTGRAQIKHGAGGFWDEWYASFNNGWTGWLAEAQGRFYFTFYKPFPDGVEAPDYDRVKPGAKFTDLVEDGALVVQEKGTASYTAADGEIPYELDPSQKYNYVDLAGKNKVFATIDYSTNPPFLFYGKEVSLDEIGFGDKKSAERAPKSVDAGAMGCPKCGGTLELKVPDMSERVTCPYCDSLLDVRENNLKYLRALKPSPSPVPYVIDIGTKGALKEFENGDEFEVIGSMTRSVTFDGIKYYWNEYLLYNYQRGFRWLVQSDDHWSWVENVNPAEIDVLPSSDPSKRKVSYKGQNYSVFQDTPANVEHVKGEFYWRVNVGESVRATDFVLAPKMLSQELGSKEVTWSLGTYVDRKKIRKGFNTPPLPSPKNVAPNQPFDGWKFLGWSSLILLLFLVTSIFLIPFTGLSRTAHSQEFLLQPLNAPNASRTVMSQSFELRGNQNVRITGLAPVKNSWVELTVDLVNQTNNEVEAVTIPIEYYFGVTDGESWSEGGDNEDATISAVPQGTYKMRIEGAWKDFRRPMPIRVKVEQNVTRGVNFCLAFVLLAIGPIIGIFRYFSFEGSRWSESMYGGTE